MYYHMCPECGRKQKSQAEERVKCHRCGRTYKEKSNRCSPPKPKKSDGVFQKASDLED